MLLDPDTGIADRRARSHTSISSIVGYLARHEIVFVFDQSFSRSADLRAQVQEKLGQLRQHGVHGFYYDSHARFLFSSLSADKLSVLRTALVRTGLPAHRLVALENEV